MKTVLSSLILILLVLLPSEQINAQTFPNMDASPMDLAIARADKNAPPQARVIYSRPSKKDRVIFGELVPFGKVWRTGANEATELTLYNAMMLGDTKVAAGSYTLYTIPGEDSWTVIINSDLNTWGAYSYKINKDAARITVPTRETVATTESLSMVFRQDIDGISLMIGWDDTYIEVPFKHI